MALLFGVGALIGILFLDFKYTYWILLTIAIVARPAFSMTKTRNIERIVGTFSGILIGISCLAFFESLPLLLSLSAIGLFGFFLFNRSNYMVSVIFITLGVVIALNLFEGNINLILGSRMAFYIGRRISNDCGILPDSSTPKLKLSAFGKGGSKLQPTLLPDYQPTPIGQSTELF
ncbi:FUSC family protein [Sphingobacterium sp. E70]|uniref:FUSC family protein n=1 Tax=Sphingobacterium sp. E70 TaxID=2853439 RepID=UPI00211CCD04|nr:FUSC family protein [Sphingobacterium sp. E70]ULT24345.1 FUSC family protein [Sphingobacterium sp. E70]